VSHGYTNEIHSILVKLGLTVEKISEVLELSIQEVSKIVGSQKT
jgi:predicted transposase YdaD